MAKQRRGEKTAAVSEYLAAHPGAGPKEIVAALAKQRIKITTAHVSNIKGKLIKGGTAKKAAKKSAAPVATTPAVAEKATSANGTITLDMVKKVAHAVRKLGGVQRLHEMLEVIKEAGGTKKFKELAEAITVADTDAIPF